MFATNLAGYDHVGFPPLLHADTTVDARIDKAFTVPANQTPILNWQAELGSHGYSPRNHSVALSQRGFLTNSLLGEAEKRVNALHGYLLDFSHHWNSKCMN